MKKILLCTDGSDYSQVCVDYAAEILEKTDAHLNAVYVTDLRQFEVPLISDLSGSLGIQPYQGMLGQLKEMEGEKAKVIEKNLRSALEQKKIGEDRISFYHKTGLLVDSLEELEKDADLVMLGKRGENADFATEHLGSTMERVVRASTKPCLVTSRSYQPVKKVVLAYDGGKSAKKALSFLTSNPYYRKFSFHVVTVVEDSSSEEQAGSHLAEAEKALTEGGVEDLRCQMLHGTPEDTISQYVIDEDIEMLIMGAYGHSRIRQLFIGSTTTEMIRRCRIPVLLFH
ncbi:MAG: universal stress protein [Opitutales bacterium]|nr:universal stress protein [Opitutales bacterium]